MCCVPTRCSRFGPARVSDFEMPEQRPVPASECRRSGSRVVGRECGGWRVEGGLGGVGCIKVAAGVLLGSQPSASLAATARPQSSSRGADVDRSAVFEAPLLRAALTSSGLETLQGTVESCNAHRQVCAGPFVSSRRFLDRSVGSVRSTELVVCCRVQPRGCECRCR